MTPKWLQAWRALAPHLSLKALQALEIAIEVDSDELIQGVTCVPSLAYATNDQEPCKACLIGYAGWRGEGLATVRQVEDYFAKMAKEIDCEIGQTHSRWLTCWFDETPRAEVFAALLPEIRAELFRRGASLVSR